MAGVDIIVMDQDFKFDSDKIATSLVAATYLASKALRRRVKVRPKQYNTNLKPIHSALKWDALGLTSLKSLPNLFPLPKSMKDLVVASWDAAKYIFFEVIWVTTTRVLERLAVLCFSPRIAWKLVRDVSASVTRMAAKGVSGFSFIFKAAKHTFLGNAIGALALWLCQVGQHIFEFFVLEKSDPVKGKWERVWILGKRILGTTVVCIISFIFACICAAIGAFVFGSIGTWIGAFTLPVVVAWIAAKLFCTSMGLLIGFAVGDFVGSSLISFCLEKLGL